MNPLLATLGDPIWQIGGGIILLAVLVLIRWFISGMRPLPVEGEVP
jgi:hypothetical protein